MRASTLQSSAAPAGTPESAARVVVLPGLIRNLSKMKLGNRRVVRVFAQADEETLGFFGAPGQHATDAHVA